MKDRNRDKMDSILPIFESPHKTHTKNSINRKYWTPCSIPVSDYLVSLRHCPLHLWLDGSALVQSSLFGFFNFLKYLSVRVWEKPESASLCASTLQFPVQSQYNSLRQNTYVCLCAKSYIHSFIQHTLFMITYYIPNVALGANKTQINKRNRSLLLLTFNSGKENK